jgi:Raf kinase inhibitor-like YbhB/YbcL family protein
MVGGRVRGLIAISCIGWLPACASGGGGTTASAAGGSSTTSRDAADQTAVSVAPSGPLAIAVEAVNRDGKYPRGLTCDGGNHPPAFAYGNVPAEAKELVMLMEEPAAPSGPFAHWVVYGIPTRRGIVDRERQPGRTTFGMNDAGTPGYTGPCPAKGTGRHEYTFTITAVPTVLTLGPNATAAEVRAAVAAAGPIATASVKTFYEQNLDTDDGKGQPAQRGNPSGDGI